MITGLCGILRECLPPVAVIDTGGVWYEVFVPTRFGVMGERVGVTCMLWIHPIIREDLQQLYGFEGRAERELFRELIRVSGVGPKLALALVSAFDPPGFMAAVLAQDLRALTAVTGVGRKTAERILVETRDRLAHVLELSAPLAGVASARLPESEVALALQALIRLGYKPQEAERAIRKIAPDAESSQDLIVRALQSFA